MAGGDLDSDGRTAAVTLRIHEKASDMIWWVLAIGAALALLVLGTVLQNRLASARVRVESAFGQIDVQLQRRHDLVPALVEAVRAAMAHERDVLERVVRARSQAARTLSDATADSPGDLAVHERSLGEAMAALVARLEAYPELRSHENVLALQEELVTTENRVAFARHAYNDAAMRLNELRATFPSSLVASALRVRAGQLLEWPDAPIAEPPRPDFSSESAT